VQNDPRLEDLIRQVEDDGRNDPHDAVVRQVVRLRARDVCEYCLQPTVGQFQVDHVIPAALWSDYMAGRLNAAIQPIENRRGPDHLDNLAWCCPFCNVGKSQRVVYRVGARTMRLFDPRYNLWTDHFTFTNHYLFIAGVTPIGVATQRALGFNAGELSGPLGT